MRTSVGLVAFWLVSSFATACGFDHGVQPFDGSVIDMPPPDMPPPDMPPMGTPTSCKAVHAAVPSAPSGAYTIDPDGSGGDPPIAVTCDMTTAGGGWTITFFAPSANMTTSPIPYTSSTTRLLADAQSALIAYRNTAQVAQGTWASFDMPNEWKLDAPFNYPAMDVTVNVSVGGSAANPAQLRFGYQNFGSRCTDPWSSSSKLGRICVAGTNAPFYNAFVDAIPDNCSNSVSDWNAAGCTADLRFSIAVR